MNAKFETTEIPAQAYSKSTEPNPYLDHAAFVASARDKAIIAEYTPGADAEAEAKALARAKKFLSLAGAEHNVTVRLGTDGEGRLIIWAVDRIARVRKPKAD